jgi:uncharacterized Ntn-hydrolase superfamily protein
MLSEGDEHDVDPLCRGQSWLRADPNPRLATHARYASQGGPPSGDVRQGTYSIVARDPSSGELGVAVQSHWFSVGSIVPWAAPDIGAVATQSIAEPAYGPRLLDRIAAGQAVGDALDALLAADQQARFRQVAAVDVRGAVAVHTGDGCIPHAGHAKGDGFCAQANLMASPDVWPAMVRAFDAAEGRLSRRMLASLEAGEAAGGDLRGRQSAALIVVPAEGEGWLRVTDLRVEDHPEPLEEMARLLDLSEAYALAAEGDELAGAGRHEQAAERYRQAARLAPDSDELLFWAGLALAKLGDLEGALERLRRAMGIHPGWRELLARLDPEIAPGAEPAREALGIERAA